MQHIRVGQYYVGTLSGIPPVCKAGVSVACHRPHGQDYSSLAIVIIAYYSLQYSKLVLGEGLLGCREENVSRCLKLQDRKRVSGRYVPSWGKGTRQWLSDPPKFCSILVSCRLLTSHSK